MPTALATAIPLHFEPGSKGIEEGVWRDVLASASDWVPPRLPLLVVSPHPDDEVLGAGGLIHTWIALGLSVIIVSVTDGEAAYPQGIIRRQDLAAIRRKELSAALRKLAPRHVAVVRLGIPDGEVAAHMNKLRNALQRLLSQRSLLIAPFDADGHPDHDAAGMVCAELAKAHDTTIGRYLVWRWHHGDVASLRDERWAKFALTAEARRAKASAVQCFASQLSPEYVSPIVPKNVLSYFERGYEAFML